MFKTIFKSTNLKLFSLSLFIIFVLNFEISATNKFRRYQTYQKTSSDIIWRFFDIFGNKFFRKYRNSVFSADLAFDRSDLWFQYIHFKTEKVQTWTWNWIRFWKWVKLFETMVMRGQSFTSLMAYHRQDINRLWWVKTEEKICSCYYYSHLKKVYVSLRHLLNDETL